MMTMMLDLTLAYFSASSLMSLGTISCFPPVTANKKVHLKQNSYRDLDVQKEVKK